MAAVLSGRDSFADRDLRDIDGGQGGRSAEGRRSSMRGKPGIPRVFHVTHLSATYVGSVSDEGANHA